MQTRSLIVAGPIALEASVRLFELRERELTEWFPPFFADCLRSLPTYDRAEEALTVIRASGALWAEELGQGGLLSALWRMAEDMQAGLSVDMKKIPIRQETVEILGLYDMDPYYALSGGAVLAVTEDPAGLLQALGAVGLSASVIGTLREGADRLLLNGSHIRCLDRPKADSFLSAGLG